MIRKDAKDELLEEFDRLTPELQQRVVTFTRQVASTAPRGVAGAELLRFAKMLSADESQRMQNVIDADCGQVDRHAW